MGLGTSPGERKLVKEQVFDMDEKNSVILVTYRDDRVAVSRARLLRLLELEERSSGLGSTGPSKTLGSLGKMIGIIRRDRAGALTAEDVGRITAALKSFDGHTAGKRSSQAGHWLREIAAWSTTPDKLKATIAAFLDAHPELESIPERKPLKPRSQTKK